MSDKLTDLICNSIIAFSAFFFLAPLVESSIVYKINIANAKEAAFSINSTTRDPRVQKIQQFINDFKEEARIVGIEVDLSNTTFSLTDLEPSPEPFYYKKSKRIAGRCHHRNQHIEISPQYARVHSAPEELRVIVYHELAHCLFGLDHTEEVQPFPVIMNKSYTISWDKLVHKKPYLWTQSRNHLFQSIKKSL